MLQEPLFLTLTKNTKYKMYTRTTLPPRDQSKKITGDQSGTQIKLNKNVFIASIFWTVLSVVPHSHSPWPKRSVSVWSLSTSFYACETSLELRLIAQNKQSLFIKISSKPRKRSLCLRSQQSYIRAHLSHHRCWHCASGVESRLMVMAPLAWSVWTDSAGSQCKNN